MYAVILSPTDFMLNTCNTTGMCVVHALERVCIDRTDLYVVSSLTHVHRDYLRPHCVRLADHFANAVVVHHTRGHVIPPLNDLQLAVFRAFLSSFLPGSGGSEVRI
jgi:hypothetical protein